MPVVVDRYILEDAGNSSSGGSLSCRRSFSPSTSTFGSRWSSQPGSHQAATGGCRDPSNTRRCLRTALSPIGSTARRELGQTLRTLRRQTGFSRTKVAQTLGWPQTRVELIETGRIKPTHRLVSSLTKTYGIDLDNTPDLLAQHREATNPAESDKLSWIRSHALRKTTATALDNVGQTARQIADQLGQARISLTQDVYLARQPANPAAAQALEHAFDDPTPI